MNDTPLTYSNPRMKAVIENWPTGGNRRGTAVFEIEQHDKRGERGTRYTIDPKNGQGKPKALTYAKQARIVDGSDGRTYVLELTGYGFISVMQSGMQYQQESINDRDPRYAATLALFNDDSPVEG